MAKNLTRLEGPLTPTALGPKSYKVLMTDDATQEQKYFIITCTTVEFADYATVCSKIEHELSGWKPSDCP